jgi:hypothetical protein
MLERAQQDHKLELDQHSAVIAELQTKISAARHTPPQRLPPRLLLCVASCCGDLCAYG